MFSKSLFRSQQTASLLVSNIPLSVALSDVSRIVTQIVETTQIPLDKPLRCEIIDRGFKDYAESKISLYGDEADLDNKLTKLEEALNEVQIESNRLKCERLTRDRLNLTNVKFQFGDRITRDQIVRKDYVDNGKKSILSRFFIATKENEGKIVVLENSSYAANANPEGVILPIASVYGPVERIIRHPAMKSMFYVVYKTALGAEAAVSSTTSETQIVPYNDTTNPIVGTIDKKAQYASSFTSDLSAIVLLKGLPRFAKPSVVSTGIKTHLDNIEDLKRIRYLHTPEMPQRDALLPICLLVCNNAHDAKIILKKLSGLNLYGRDIAASEYIYTDPDDMVSW